MSKPIRVVVNKNNSLTVYVPACHVENYTSMLNAGETDIVESEMNEFEIDEWQTKGGFQWEYKA